MSMLKFSLEDVGELSSDQNSGYFAVGDEILPSCMGILANHSKDPGS